MTTTGHRCYRRAAGRVPAGVGRHADPPGVPPCNREGPLPALGQRQGAHAEARPVTRVTAVTAACLRGPRPSVRQDPDAAVALVGYYQVAVGVDRYRVWADL